MGTAERHNRRRHWPPLEFWGALGVAASLLAPFLSERVALVLGLVFLALALLSLRQPVSPAAETSVAGAGATVPPPEKDSTMTEKFASVEQGFRVSFPGPFQHHDVVVEGWRVPFLEAHMVGEDRVSLVIDRRLSTELSVEEAERVVPFVADAISVALGYGAHPRGDMPLPERTPHPSPRRVHEVVDGPESV